MTDRCQLHQPAARWGIQPGYEGGRTRIGAAALPAGLVLTDVPGGPILAADGRRPLARNCSTLPVALLHGQAGTGRP